MQMCQKWTPYYFQHHQDDFKVFHLSRTYYHGKILTFISNTDSTQFAPKLLGIMAIKIINSLLIRIQIASFGSMYAAVIMFSLVYLLCFFKGSELIHNSASHISFHNAVKFLSHHGLFILFFLLFRLFFIYVLFILRRLSIYFQIVWTKLS